MGKLNDLLNETSFKCILCGERVVNNRFTTPKRFEGFVDVSICLKCLKKKLNEIN